MKKNVLTKVVLLMVIAMLALALVACDGLFGGNTDNGGNNNNNNNNTGNTDDPGKEPEEPVDAVGKIVEVVKKAGTLIDTVTEINANKTVGLDIAVGGTIKAGENFNHSAGLSLRANARSEGARADLAVKVDGESYAGIGYGTGSEGGTLYITQPLNLINSTSTEARKVQVSVAALEDSIDHMTTEGMKALQYLAGMEALKNLDFDALADSLAGGEEGEPGLLDMVSDVLLISDVNGKTVIELDAENVGYLLPVVETAVPNFDGIVDTIETIADTLGIEIEGQPLTYELIKTNYCPGLAIEVGYANDTISQIAVKIVIDSIDFEFALVIDLNTFKVVGANEDAVSQITFPMYEKRDLEASVGLDLGVKGIDAVLDLVLHTSDALKEDGNHVADAKLTVNGVQAAAGVFNGKTVYLNANEAFNVLNADGEGYKTEYAYSLGKSVIEMINDAITENVVFMPELNPASAAAEGEASIFQTIYDLVYSVIGITGLVEEMPAPATGIETFEDLDPAVTSLLVTTIGEYTHFLDAETESLMDALANIIAIYNENKDLLLNAVHADSILLEGDAGVKLVAGAQLTNVIDEDSADLADFVLKFINVKLDGENTSTVQDLIDFGVALVDGLWALVPDGTDPEGSGIDYTTLFNADFIEGIVGVNLDTLLQQLYVSAGTMKDQGLNGWVEVKTTKDGASYAKLSGKIYFDTYMPDTDFYDRDNYFVEIPENLIDVAVSFAATVETPVSGFGSYYVTDMLFGLLQAVLAYEAPVAA